MVDKLPPPIKAGDPDFACEMDIMHEVMARRHNALRLLALSDSIAEEGFELLRESPKS